MQLETGQNQIIPAPRCFVGGEGTLTLGPGDSVVVTTGDLAAVAAQFVADVASAGGPRLSIGSTGTVRLAVDPDLAAGVIAPAAGLDPGGDGPRSEVHQIVVTGAGAFVRGTTAEAVFRGLTSLRQMIELAGVEDDGKVSLSMVDVIDGPRYAWRGLSLDVARTFFTVDEVKRVVDQLARFKLNVLHLHLTDDQGWRFDVEAWPNLTATGGRGAVGDRPGGFYSRAEVQELVAYAEARFVTVVPEIDLPGHCTAVFDSYPELRPARPGTPPGMPGGSLDPDHPGTIDFVGDVLAEVAAAFPSRHIHIGADEPFGMDEEKYARFVAEQCRIVEALGRSPIGWQESARAGEGAPPVVQYWMHTPEGMPTPDDYAGLGLDIPAEMLADVARSVARSVTDLPAAVSANRSIMMSPLENTYLDRPYSETGAAEQEGDRSRLGLGLYPGGTVRESVDWDPLALVDEVTSDDQVAGVEAVIWCETLATFAELQFMVQPRLAGVAERAWSEPGPLDWTEFSSRLARQGAAWSGDGWNFFRSTSVDWPDPA